MGLWLCPTGFFPLYPNLIRNLASTFKNPVISGVLISNLSFLISLIFLARLIRLDYDVNTTKFAIIALLLFPTSFYFGSVYTEGLFFSWLYPRFMQPVAAAGGWLGFWGPWPPTLVLLAFS